MNLLLTLVLSGYGFGYDGSEQNNHYFHVNTPNADYGIVVSDQEIYCDVVSIKS
jgi:hypothetical protein